MLCHGPGCLGKRSIAVLTDYCTRAAVAGIRRYTPLAATGDRRINWRKIVAKLESTRPKSCWGLIDGGGAIVRSMDKKFYEMSGLVLPASASHTKISARVRQPTSTFFPRAYGIPSQWPTNP